MTTEISLKQAPVIQYKEELAKIGKSIDERLKKLNLDGQIATVETIKYLKDLRADFNKELKECEAFRTTIKKGVLAPYDEFETEYKIEIKEKFEKAVETLKDKISFVEDDLRKKKEDGIKDYFKELCLNKNIDFLTFDQADISINLSTADKQYKEKCIEFVNKVADDLELIDTQLNKTEILVEYKTSLNAARSIKTVQERKVTIEKAEEQEKQNQLNKRTQIVIGLGFVSDDILARYVRGDVSISYEAVENLTTEAFKDWALSMEVIPTSFKSEQPLVLSDDVVFVDTPVFSTPKLQTLTYIVKGTSLQLSGLDKYLQDNNIKFENKL